MTKKQIFAHLMTCNEVAIEAMRDGRHPFGAALIAPDNEEVLLTQGNIDVVRHAEVELARNASSLFEADYLFGCTLVTTVEPCAMCAGALYWANIGGLVYGVSEATLRELTAKDNRNPTLSMPSRKVLRSGQKKIAISGPFKELETELLAPHKEFWKS